jgi:predicted ArsR family transcriptional regulator
MSQTSAVTLALVDPSPNTKWFDATSCVLLGEGGIRQVFVGGRLVGSFGEKDRAERNVMLIAVSEEPKAHLGHIADAFGVSSETLRQLRQLVERSGIEAVARRKRGGSSGRRMSARDQAKVVASFEEGATIEGAWEQIRRRASRATVGRAKKEWDARALVTAAEPVAVARQQAHLDEVVAAVASADSAHAMEASDAPTGSNVSRSPTASS